MGGDGYLPLFETKTAKGRIAYQLYAVSVFVGICFICAYRVSHLPPTTTTTTTQDGSRWAWIGLFIAELWFIFYWFITQFARWNPIYRHTFKDRLSQRYEKDLPGVDVFVCTADPTIEPPIMVVNTVLSVMAYDYPPEKLSVYLSDDGGSELTFYALLEASRFAKHWLPFCKKFNVVPRSPAVYFSTDRSFVDDDDPLMATQWSSIKNLYEDMRNRIERITKIGQIPADIRKEHKGFCEWDLVSSRHDHPVILQILIDGREPKGVEIEGQLPTLVYLSREKRPQYHHHFKAGAMNALVNPVVEEPKWDKGFIREEEVCTKEPDQRIGSNDCHLGEEVNTIIEETILEESVHSPNVIVEQVSTPGFIKSFSGSRDGSGLGINLEVDLSQALSKNLNRKGLLSLNQSGLVRQPTSVPKLLRNDKRRRKKKVQLEGFTSFARLHGQKAAAVSKHTSKSVIFRPAAAMIARSDLSEDITSPNNLLLNEAKATIQLGWNCWSPC